MSFTIWFVGLPCSGKTTIAKEVKKFLKASTGRPIVHLDGDYMRDGLTKGLGFSDEGICENLMRATYVAKLLNEQGIVVVASFISPFEKMRKFAREQINRYIEVWVDCPPEICKKRDVKGMWKLAEEGKLKDFIDQDRFEAPSNCALRLDTSLHSIKCCARKAIYFCEVRK